MSWNGCVWWWVGAVTVTVTVVTVPGADQTATTCHGETDGKLTGGGVGRYGTGTVTCLVCFVGGKEGDPEWGF